MCRAAVAHMMWKYQWCRRHAAGMRRRSIHFLVTPAPHPNPLPKRLCHNEEISVIVILNLSPVILSPSLCHSSMLKSKSLFYMGVDREIIILGIPNL